jgi:cytoskeletal protein RodZ
VISGQKEPVQRVAEPQSQSSTEARQEATSLPEAQKTEAGEPDALQSLDNDKIACLDSGVVNEKIASRRSLYIMIVAAIIVAGILGVGASVGYRSSASPPPEIALLSDNGPAESQQTNRSDVPTPDTAIPGTAPQPSPTAVNNVEQPLDPSQPRETVPAAEVAASPEQIETQVQPAGPTAFIEPEKMNTAPVEQLFPVTSRREPNPR